MRRSIFSFICLGLLLLGPCLSPGALELELSGGLNNLTFHPDRVTGHSVSRNYKKFQSYPFFVGDFVMQSNSFEKLGFKIHFSRDNILRNSLYGQVKANLDYVNLEFGPFIGMDDSLGVPEVGIKGGFEVTFPGIVFFSLNGSSSLASKYDFFSDNTRETAEFRIGFWVPHVIPSISASIKGYTRRPDDTVELRDELIRLQLSADINTKNFPLLVRIDAGYEILSRSYDREKSNGSSIKDELSAVFVGAEAKMQVNKMVKVILGFEIPVYCITEEPMEKPLSFSLFKAQAGIGINLY